MARGRRAQPDALREARGNPGKRRPKSVLLDPAQLGANAVASPVALSPDAERVWAGLAPMLESVRFLRQTDAHAFARYCADLALYWQVSQRLEQRGVTYTTESAHGKMDRIRPDFLVQERLVTRLTQAEDRFGLNPAARQQLMLQLSRGTQAPLPFERPAEASPPASPTEGLALPQPASPIGVLRRQSDDQVH